MKHFVYIIYIVVILHALASMVGALCCLAGNQPGLSLVLLVMTFVFVVIARKYEKLWKALQ